MPRYEFISDDGETREEFYSVDDAPSIGDAVTIDGKKYRRAPVVPQGLVRESIGFKSYSLPPNYKYHADRGGKFDTDGQPIFTSRKELGETLAAANDHEEELFYD